MTTSTATPIDGVSRCACGCKYWQNATCIDCGYKYTKACEQGCHNPAQCYAMGPYAGDWGGYYCFDCAKALKFNITDYLTKGA